MTTTLVKAAATAGIAAIIALPFNGASVLLCASIAAVGVIIGAL